MRGNPLLVALSVVGALASVIALFVYVADRNCAMPSFLSGGLNQQGTNGTAQRSGVAPVAGHASRDPAPGSPDGGADPRAEILRRCYASPEALLAEISSVEERIRALKHDMAALRAEQRQFYSERTFAGSRQLNQWRAELSGLHDNIRDAEARRRALEADHQEWVRLASESAK